MARPLDIPRIALGPPTGPSGTDALALKSWRVGQILPISVVEAPTAGRAVLMMAGQRVEAQTEIPLTAGQRLTARVETADPPQVLRILASADPDSLGGSEVRSAQPPPPTNRGTPEAVLREALRSVLPSAGSLGGALESVTRLLTEVRAPANLSPAPAPSPAASLAGASSPTASPAAAPSGTAPALAQTAAAVDTLLASLPTLTQVSKGPGLRTAVQDSGTFLEARLAATAPGQPPPTDLKAQLLRLATLLPRAATQAEPLVLPPHAAMAENTAQPPSKLPDGPPTLPAGVSAGILRTSSEVEAAIARIELNQLRAVPHGEGPHPGWLVEVPVRTTDHLDVLSLYIEPETGSDPGRDPHPWSISLALDLEALGPIQARVVWQAGSVAATLWAEDPGTLDLLRQRSEELTVALRSAGLEPRGVHCLPGPGPGFRTPHLPHTLLDLRA